MQIQSDNKIQDPIINTSMTLCDKKIISIKTEIDTTDDNAASIAILPGKMDTSIIKSEKDLSVSFISGAIDNLKEENSDLNNSPNHLDNIKERLASDDDMQDSKEFFSPLFSDTTNKIEVGEDDRRFSFKMETDANNQYNCIENSPSMLSEEISNPSIENVENNSNGRSIENMSSTDTGDEETAVPDFCPPKKRLRKGHFEAKTKEMILHIYQNEYFNNPDMLVKTVATRVAMKTGVSYRSVERIISEYKRNGVFSEPKPKPKRQTALDLLTEWDKTAIRRKVHEFVFRNEIPTVEKILTVVNKDPDLPSFKISTFRKVLKKLNFVFAKCQRNSFLMDRDDIKCWRRDFLTKIKAYRNENRKIYYLDETCLTSKQTFLDGLSTGLKNPSGKEQRIIVCHIGNEDGFVPGGLWIFRPNKSGGDYREEIDGASFEKWFANIISMLEENAVIVLDSAPYHSGKLEKIPTTVSRKSDIQLWLRSKDIDFEENMIKAQLLRLVNENKHRFNKYVVDEMAKKQNKTVLRLPPNHCELNPIELIWTDVKNFVAVKNRTVKFADMENLVQDAISNITPAKWQKCVQHVQQKVEIEMWTLDNIIDEMETEPSVIRRLEENSTSQSENDST